MGDFFAPKKKDVVDKLRRRLDLYRHHHSATVDRYLIARPGIYEQQKQETLLLKQRCLETKIKKAKQSKASRDNNITQSDHRNLLVTKLKKKIDSVSAEGNTSSSTTAATTTASETVFSFDDKDLLSSGINSSKINNSSSNNIGGGGSKHGSGLPSLSVQIVQQISAHPQQDTSQTIHTNVTVSSHYGTDSPNSGSTSVHTSVQCKQESTEDSARSSSSSCAAHNSHIDPSSVGDIGIGIDDVDELQNILDSIEKDEDIEPSLLKELNEFNEIYDKVQRDSESNESCNMYGGPLACGSPGLSKGVFSNLGSGGHISSIFDSNQNMNAAAMTNHTNSVPSPIAEPTGPAAETLKQMAAQHQHQHSPGYPMKGLDHFTDGLRNGGFPPNYSSLYRSVPNTASAFPYNHMTNHHMGDSSHMTPEMAAAMGYGGTKPLTHFPNEPGQHHNSPSSLQQLQNQVQSHFKPSSAAPHQLQIMQSQHVQVSHGTHNLQLSQSQQIQMQPSAQHISLSQQQNFNMGQQQMVSEQMKMQMMEKMRMEQQQQQQQQAQQGRMPPQYMGRPPPEYKMHHSARPQGPYAGATVSNGNQNPLQTMQNMVNQTQAYGTVKSEVVSGSSSGQANNGMVSSQISAMQQQSMSASMVSNGSHIGNMPQSSQARPGFLAQQHMQQPPAYSAVESSTCAQSSSTYTSAALRSQRPPSVNICPDGLNLPQPRTHTDWSPASVLQTGHSGMRSGMPSGCSSPHDLAQSASMSAHLMQYQQQQQQQCRPPHYGGSANAGSMAAAAAAAAAATNMAQLQQQQLRQPMPGQMRGGPNPGLMAGGSQMMMQHQSMQVSQQMSMHASNSGYMGIPSPGATSVPPAGYNIGVPSPGSSMHGGGGSNSQSNVSQSVGFLGPPSASNPDEFLHFLDNPLSNQPMFDSIQNTADDFSLFEDILSGK